LRWNSTKYYSSGSPSAFVVVFQTEEDEEIVVDDPEQDDCHVTQFQPADYKVFPNNANCLNRSVQASSSELLDASIASAGQF
jgi:hypothetical protein